jgi:hypothetical protein
MLVHIVPTSILYLLIKYTSVWKITQEHIKCIITKKEFTGIFTISGLIIFAGCLFFLSKPVNYANGAIVIKGTEAFEENRPISLALRNIEDPQYSKAKEPGNITVIIDLQKEVHANIIEMVNISDSTDASAQRILTDISWAVSLDQYNWVDIYSPPSSNMSNVRKVHNNKFQYPIGQIEIFRYLRLTYKPVNPQECLKIEQINVWSHSPDGYYPD